MSRNIFVDGVILLPNQSTKNYVGGEPKQFFLVLIQLLPQIPYEGKAFDFAWHDYISFFKILP